MLLNLYNNQTASVDAVWMEYIERVFN